MTTKHLTPFILGAVVGSVFFSILVSAWTAPSGTPPANNASAPVNLGPAAQVKNGNIGVNGLAVFGNTAMQGNLVLTQGNLTATTPNASTSAIVATGPSSGFAGYAVSASAGSYNASLARADGYSFVGTGQLYNVGLIHSTSGGIQFPDGTVQTSAANAAATHAQVIYNCPIYISTLCSSTCVGLSVNSSCTLTSFDSRNNCTMTSTYVCTQVGYLVR